MHIGQHVYVQKDEIQFHVWYKVRIIDIRRRKRPASQGTPLWCLVDVLTCCQTVPLEYVVKYQDDIIQVVSRDRLEEHF